MASSLPFRSKPPPTIRHPEGTEAWHDIPVADSSTPLMKGRSSTFSTPPGISRRGRSRSRSRSPATLTLPIRTRSPDPSRRQPNPATFEPTLQQPKTTQLHGQGLETAISHPGLLIPDTKEWIEAEQRRINATKDAALPYTDSQINAFRSRIAGLSLQNWASGKYEMTQEELDTVAQEWLDSVGWVTSADISTEAPYFLLDQWLDLVEREKVEGEGEKYGKGPDALLEEYYRNKAKGEEQGASGGLSPLMLSPELPPIEDNEVQNQDMAESAAQGSSYANDGLAVTPEPHLDELCLSLRCFVDYPHPVGRYLARRHIPRTYNDLWGLSDPPDMVWEAWARINDGNPGECDDSVVQGFAAVHFWDGPEAADEAGERLLGSRV